MTDDGEVLPVMLDRVEQIRETTSCVRGTNVGHEIRLSDSGPRRNCAFNTDRLDIGGWHEISGSYDLDLVAEVARVLTAATTPALPAEWHGDFTIERAQCWIAERDAEWATLLAVNRASNTTIGLLILFEISTEEASRVDLRLGYVLAESAWGRGFASELVAGLVAWARSQPSIRSISGGVAASNPASAQVLMKNGFALAADLAAGEQVYELDLGN